VNAVHRGHGEDLLATLGGDRLGDHGIGEEDDWGDRFSPTGRHNPMAVRSSGQAASIGLGHDAVEGHHRVAGHRFQ
jgi:hypothetical protein